MIDTLRKRRDEGFTLIELLIVIIILAILAAIVVFAVGSTAGNAKVASCKADAKSVETALEAYKAQNQGTYPGSLTDLTASTVNGASTTGPWLRATPTANTSDNGYAISYDGAGGVFVETSGGAFKNFDTTAAACG